MDGMEDQYSVLIRFDHQDSTDSFYKHYNGRRFSSLEVPSLFLILIIIHFFQLFARFMTELNFPCYLLINRRLSFAEFFLR